MQLISHTRSICNFYILLLVIIAVSKHNIVNAATQKKMSATRIQKVYVHVGPSKTGTSYIQSVLSRLKTKLLKHYICWPGEERDSAFVPLAEALDADDKAVVAKFKQNIDRCLAQGHDIIISSEHFHFMKHPKAFYDFFRNYNTHIIAYHREYLSKQYSHYTQHYKTLANPISFANFIPLATNNPHHYAENGNNRQILRTYRHMFGLGNMTLVDYDGAIAAGKDIAFVLICDILHAKCDLLPPVKVRSVNSRPEMLPYNVMALVHRFVHSLGCTLCNENDASTIKDLVDKYSALKVHFPLRTTGLQTLHAVAEEESKSYRREFGSIMLYNNHSATMAVSDRFSVVELDEQAFYRDASCMSWLRQEVGRLHRKKSICSCPKSIDVLVKALDTNSIKDRQS